MTSPTRLLRFLLIAVIVLFQLQFPSLGKSAKRNETEGLVYATFPGQPKPTTDMLGDLVRQSRWDNGEFGIGNEERLRLRFVKVDDQVKPESTIARYRIFANGAPANKVYAWGVWQAGDEPKSEPQDIYVNASGLLMTHRPSPAEESSLQVPGGEFLITPDADSAVPIRYEIVSRDNQFSMSGTLVPRPVASVDQGCSLEARVAEPHAEAVLLVADVFPPDSKIPLVLESEGQTANLTMDIDSTGHSIVAAFPFVQGKTHGMLKVTAEGPNCLPSVTLPWGAEAQPASKTP